MKCSDLLRPTAVRDMNDDSAPIDDGMLSAFLLAIAPEALKGAVLYGESRGSGELWLRAFESLLSSPSLLKRVPGNISDERLLGGLDLTATISRGHAVSDRGLLTEADGGAVVLSGATTRHSTYAHICSALDTGGISVERDGLSELHRTQFAVIVLQTVDDDSVPGAVIDRVAFHLSPDRTNTPALFEQQSRVEEARRRFATVQVDDSGMVALTETAQQLGIQSPRATLMALAAARAHAAWESRIRVNQADLLVASRLVLAPRALNSSNESASAQANEPEESKAGDEPAPPKPDSLNDGNDADDITNTETTPFSANDTLSDVLVRASQSALPAGLLASFAARSLASRNSANRNESGRSKGDVTRDVRGRQVGVTRGIPRGGARLDVVATIRAALPWQRIRQREDANASVPTRERLLSLRRDDLRIRQCIAPSTTTALFVVDASGSSARQRLAETKGAIELMLAEGYARRDRVALICFRGTTAELVLPTTHALARARRTITALPAGGGTPLATALDLASTVLQRLARGGGQVVTVILTDGRANVARDGRGGRAQAFDDAMESAVRVRNACGRVLWVDTSPKSDPPSRQLAERAGARYLLLPTANARALTNAVREAAGATTSHGMSA